MSSEQPVYCLVVDADIECHQICLQSAADISIVCQQEQRNGVSAEEFHSLGRQLHDVTERIEIRTNPGPPGPERDMNFDEKRKLSVYIGSLDGDKLERVFEIITQEEPDLPGMTSQHIHSASFDASTALRLSTVLVQVHQQSACL